MSQSELRGLLSSPGRGGQAGRTPGAAAGRAARADRVQERLQSVEANALRSGGLDGEVEQLEEVGDLLPGDNWLAGGHDDRPKLTNKMNAVLEEARGVGG